MEKTPVHFLRHIIVRAMAWGFSSSGVERTFSRGAWCKSNQRDVPQDLANDEIRAVHYDGENQDGPLNLISSDSPKNISSS